MASLISKQQAKVAVLLKGKSPAALSNDLDLEWQNVSEVVAIVWIPSRVNHLHT